jgi:hypothetical protein
VSLDTVKRGAIAYATTAWRGDVLGDAMAARDENDSSSMRASAAGEAVVILDVAQTPANSSDAWLPVSFTDETGERYYVPNAAVTNVSDTSVPSVDADIQYLAQKAKEDDAMMPLFWLIAILGFVMANR